MQPVWSGQTFWTVWQTLSLTQQARLLERLVERVDHHAAQQTVSIAFLPDSSTALAEELARLAPETMP